MSAFGIIKRLEKLQEIRDLLSDSIRAERGRVTIAFDKSMNFIELDDKADIHNVLRGIDKRVAELEGEIDKL